MKSYKKAALMLVIVVLAIATAVPAMAQSDEPIKLVVWDFKSGEAAFSPYTEAVAERFHEAYPNITVEVVPQPNDQYYTILGTAINAGEGPDLALFNGGAAIKDRVEALLPLTDAVADIYDNYAGWDAFSVDGEVYAVPLTMQGFVTYYNKELYTEAGLDPDVPPTTWDELIANCDAIMSNTDANCFALGNQEGLGIEFFFSTAMAGLLTPDRYDAFLNGEIGWDDPALFEAMDLWRQTAEWGWYPEGANSTPMFVDSFESFMRGDAAHVLGLTSDIAHWKDFEDFLGAENVGSFLPVIINPEVTDQVLPIDGGIGYGVTAWTEHPEEAMELAKFMLESDNLYVLFESAGAMVSDKMFDTSVLDSPNATQIIEWIGCCSRGATSIAVPTAPREEMKRQGQLLLGGDTTTEDAVAAILAATEE